MFADPGTEEEAPEEEEASTSHEFEDERANNRSFGLQTRRTRVLLLVAIVLVLTLAIALPISLLSKQSDGDEAHNALASTSAPRHPTLPVGGNPQTTAKPASQRGTLGPTTQVLSQSFGETVAPAPTTSPLTSEEVEFRDLLLRSLSLPTETEKAILHNSSSAPRKAFALLTEDPRIRQILLNAEEDTSYPLWRWEQRFVLAVFYYSTSGPQWIHNDNWLDVDQHECDWWSHPQNFSGPNDLFRFVDEVPCGNWTTPNSSNNTITNIFQQAAETRYGEYKHLWLLENGLNGSLPPQIGLLTSLVTIRLDQRPKAKSWPRTPKSPRLAGALPSEIALLTNLRALTLNHNELTGQTQNLPSTLSKSIEVLGLDKNALTGPFPPSMVTLSRLRRFNMSSTVDGARSVEGMPTALGNLTGLEELSLGLESASRDSSAPFRISTEVGRLSLLTHLQLEVPQLDGLPIPTELGLLTRLQHLRIWQNDGSSGYIEGWIDGMEPPEPYPDYSGVDLPQELGRLSHLKFLSLYKIKLGPFFPEQVVTKLTSLEKLQLHTCNIFGRIPTSIVALTALKILDLTHNSLTGQLPVELYEMINLTTLRLYLNHLKAPFLTVTNLTFLEEIDLRMNRFTGVLGTEVGLMTTLKSFQISQKHPYYETIAGTIPTEIGMMTSLSKLHINFDLLGTIPSEIGKLTLMEDLQMIQCSLNGTIPTEIWSLSGLQSLRLDENFFSPSTLPSSLWRLSNHLTSLGLAGSYGIGHPLTGTIPSEIGLMTNLSRLYLNINNLTNSLPTEVGDMTSLWMLSLSWNDLDGPLPSELGLLDDLGFAFLEGNNFTGTVPIEYQHLSQVGLLPNPGLTGSLPESLCGIVTLYCGSEGSLCGCGCNCSSE